MGTISLSLPSDGQTIDSSDVNTPFNTIANEINGNLDNSNIKAGAAIDRSKIAGFTDGWENLGYAPNTITANGNRSYDVVFSSVDLTSATSVGQRLKLPRTVTAPTQCTDLESGSSQYFSKSSPSGMTFTDDFTVSAWVKLESYSNPGTIASRYNGTSGWRLQVDATGQVQLVGFNAGSGNYSYVQSYQSVPLNKWVHIAAQLDMSTFTATTTTSYVMIDGIDVPALVGRAGTNPTSIPAGGAGNLEIGSSNGGTTLFDGKLAQVAIYSAKVTQATILASMNQTLTGSETSLVSAYTFNNSINDLSANANNLTANGSAVATNADTPFTNSVTGTNVTAGTTNYGIIMSQSFSTNTTYTIQVPEGETLPTSGGIGTVYYSAQKTPYGFPGQKGKWTVSLLSRASQNFSPAILTWTYTNLLLNIPVGEWTYGYSVCMGMSKTTAASNVSVTLSSASATESSTALSAIQYFNASGATTHNMIGRMIKDSSVTTSTMTPYYFNVLTGEGGTNTISIYGGTQYGDSEIFAENAYL